jgi:hypothetical protein
MISYIGTYLDENLRIHGSYRFADSQYDEQNESFTNNGRDGYSASASYLIPNINLEFGVGYAEQGESDEVMIGANYGIGGFYAAVLFTDGQEDDYLGFSDTFVNNASCQGQEAALSYLFADKYKLSATYNDSETGGYTTVDETAIEARYYFAPKCALICHITLTRFQQATPSRIVITLAHLLQQQIKMLKTKWRLVFVTISNHVKHSGYNSYP